MLQPAKTTISAPQITEFHIKGAVALKPIIQGESSNHAPSAQDGRHRPGPVDDAVDRKSHEQQHGEADDPQI